MAKVWLLILFIRSGSEFVVGPTFEVGEYPSLDDCKAAADTAVAKPDHGDDPIEWQPFIAQWACVQRPSRFTK